MVVGVEVESAVDDCVGVGIYIVAELGLGEQQRVVGAVLVVEGLTLCTSASELSGRVHISESASTNAATVRLRRQEVITVDNSVTAIRMNMKQKNLLIGLLI